MSGVDQGRYADAVNDALERLAGDGPVWGPGLAAHAPMAAEALASLGFYDEVPRWVERYRTDRRYAVLPESREPLVAGDRAGQDAALGDFGRFADWVALFERELAERAWRDVLLEWWPRLLPGGAGILGHGLIRAAHAARGLDLAGEPTAVQLGEFAQGLALWAAKFWVPPGGGALPPGTLPPGASAAPAAEDARRALVEATARVAGTLADRPPAPAVPIVHSVTIPMAVDMMLPMLPLSLHQEAYRQALIASGAIFRTFAGHLPAEGRRRGGAPGPVPSLREGIAAAVETGDEHAIKLAEVCARGATAHVDNEPYLRAVAMLVHQLGNGRAMPGFRR
ncbi:hypothetical protein [Streptomyces sp. NBC_01803]|uniref:hypothetical protein n=1 Tax=Streptomyces sp. NBC_01803 TaxID=2975946 RepID=UPI002DD7C1C6|nr:hypothetical protein [Streptomyces sp. NBC_01803]WSA46097.1 hypothetical protein OIE51_19005 [Streptomyces sp. NBC_01803]